MTGFGRAEVIKRGITATVEIRGVNNRNLDVTTRLPRLLAKREIQIKDTVRSRVNRGNVSVAITIQDRSTRSVPRTINESASRGYFKLLNDLRNTVKIREHVKLEHLLKFTDVFGVPPEEQPDEEEWSVVEQALVAALQSFNIMRQNEGSELAKDFHRRMQRLSELVQEVSRMSCVSAPENRKRLLGQISELSKNRGVMGQNRLEFEIALLADKLDMAEECARLRSHTEFFLQIMEDSECAGRRLNFLMQEFSRQANAMSSKTNDSAIASKVAEIKEELEKIREQLQNIE